MRSPIIYECNNFKRYATINLRIGFKFFITVDNERKLLSVNLCFYSAS